MTRAQLATHVAALALGAVAATIVTTHGAREVIQVAVGDTLVPRFSVRTDSILSVVGTRIVVSRCGQSFIFLRNVRPNAVQLSADTVEVDAPCPVVAVAPDTVVDSVAVFLAFTQDSAGNIVGQTTIADTIGSKRCAYVEAWNKERQILTGVPVHLTVADTTVLRVDSTNVLPSGQVCPDTTINPLILASPPRAATTSG